MQAIVVAETALMRIEKRFGLGYRHASPPERQPVRSSSAVNLLPNMSGMTKVTLCKGQY